MGWPLSASRQSTLRSRDRPRRRRRRGHFTFDVHFRAPAPISVGAKSDVDIPGAHGGLILQLGPDEFLVAGTGMHITFAVRDNPKAHAGIDSIWEGHFERGAWVSGRNLNGDDDNQGRSLRIPAEQFTIRRVRLYIYH